MSHAGEVLLNGENIFDIAPRRARRQGRVSRLPISAGNSRRRDDDVPAHRAQRAAARARRGRAVDAGIHEARQRGRGASSASIKDMLRRPLNVGFSGGEKKRNEILQMALLEPRLCILDETDSGLDIDALRIVAEGVNAMRAPIAASSSSPTTSGCWITSCPTPCM